MIIDTINRGEYLFRRGEPDEWIYVIQDGQIDLLVHENGQDRPISERVTNFIGLNLFNRFDFFMIVNQPLLGPKNMHLVFS